MKIKSTIGSIFLVFIHLVCFFLIYNYPDLKLFLIFIPIISVVNLSDNKQVRNTFITIFVILWFALFQYESLRRFYLNRFFKQELPKTKFLFPPAGWIMFYEVGKSGGNIEVFGVKDGQSHLIDPHDIFRTRTIGYDNIQRGILYSVTDRKPQNAAQFCRFLNYRFPYFDKYYVSASYYPDMTVQPYHRIQRIMYQCDDKYLRFMK